MLILLRKSQMGLFATIPVHVKGSVRKDGTRVADHMSVRRKKLEPHQAAEHHQAGLFGDAPTPVAAVGAKLGAKLSQFLARHGGAARMADTLASFTPEQRAKMLDMMATLGGVTAETLRAHWSLASSGGQRQERTQRGQMADSASASSDQQARGDGSAAPWRSKFKRESNARYAPAKRAPLRAATPLDRAAQILLNKADLWLQYPAEVHELLCEAPPPYGELFARFERVLHDQGPLPLHGMVDELLRDADPDNDGLRQVVERLRGLHELSDEASTAEQLQAILNGLKLDAVNDEINLLLESGELSQAAVLRRNELMTLRASLKGKA